MESKIAGALRMSVQGERRSGDGLTFGQVGWIGQTGTVYGLDVDPGEHEPGGFAPLWLEIGE